MRNARVGQPALTSGNAPPGETSVVERPPPGLARGPYAVPSGLVVAVAVALVLLTLGYYVLRLRRARRR